MTETRRTTTTQVNGGQPIMQTSTNSVVETKLSTLQYVEQLVNFAVGVLEVLLAFRFVLKLSGANPFSPFVEIIYMITKMFIFPFEGIFRRGITSGIETSSVFEPATLVALIVYAVLAWGLIALLRTVSGKEQSA